jgi:hypothetical protein
VKNISPQFIGAKPMRGARRPERFSDFLFGRAVGRNAIGQDGRQDKHGDDDQSHCRQARVHQARKEIAPASTLGRL